MKPLQINEPSPNFSRYGMAVRLILKRVLLVMLSICFIGCSSKRLDNIKQNAVLAKCDKLVECYLTEDVEGARRCLKEEADLVEGAIILEPVGRAAILALTYARVSILEERSGNTWEAEAGLVKAKFWALKCAELRGSAPDVAMKTIQEESTPDSLLASVYERDKTINNGRLPNYLNSFTNLSGGKN